LDEKAEQIGQVRIKKMNASEPSMKGRENELSVRTAGLFRPEEEHSGYLSTGYAAGVIKGA
jgi:hypothetical protein